MLSLSSSYMDEKVNYFISTDDSQLDADGSSSLLFLAMLLFGITINFLKKKVYDINNIESQNDWDFL